MQLRPKRRLGTLRFKTLKQVQSQPVGVCHTVVSPKRAEVRRNDAAAGIGYNRRTTKALCRVRQQSLASPVTAMHVAGQRLGDWRSRSPGQSGKDAAVRDGPLGLTAEPQPFQLLF